MKRHLLLSLLLLAVLAMQAQRRYDCTIVLFLEDDGCVLFIENRQYEGQEEKEKMPMVRVRGAVTAREERDTLSALLLHKGAHDDMKSLTVLVARRDDKKMSEADADLRLEGTDSRVTNRQDTHIAIKAAKVPEDAEVWLVGTLKHGYLTKIAVAKPEAPKTVADSSSVAKSDSVAESKNDLTVSHFTKYDKDIPISIGMAILMITMVVLPLGLFVYFKIDIGLGGYIIMSFFNAVFFLWDVITLKHLRRLINRIRYVGFSFKKSKYLPMMGGLTETQLLRRQITPLRIRSDGRLWKAMIWRMVANGDLSFSTNALGKVTLMPTWRGGSGDGMDLRVTQYMYDILGSLTDYKDRSITPWTTMRALFGGMTSASNIGGSEKAIYSSEKLMFLLRSNVKLNKRKKEPIRQIYAFRRYLKSIRTGADPSYDLSRLWGDYVAFACLYGIEGDVLSGVLSQLRCRTQLSGVSLMLAQDPKKVKLVKRVARAAAFASPCVTIQGIRASGFLPIARIIHEHLDEPLM